MPRSRPADVPGPREALAELEAADDGRLVASTLEGRREAFEVLVRRHQRGVVNHLYRLLGRRDAAMDVAQETFIRVYQSLDAFDPRYRFTTWLYRIASNGAIDRLRRRGLPTCSLNAGVVDEDGRVAEREFPADGPSPLDVLRCRELEDRIEAALAELPTSYRELILLRHRGQCRYDEIARITGLPLGTVKNRIFRARELMRERLADILDVGGAP